VKAFDVFHFNHLPPLCVSLPSFFARRHLFSITCSLFSQNTRGGGTLAHLAFGINNIQPLSLHPVAMSYQSSPLSAVLRFRVSIFAFRVSILLARCFHTLTNRFSHNSFLFTSIQIPGGVPLSTHFFGLLVPTPRADLE
jgi:hypothetical protein